MSKLLTGNIVMKSCEYALEADTEHKFIFIFASHRGCYTVRTVPCILKTDAVTKNYYWAIQTYFAVFYLSYQWDYLFWNNLYIVSNIIKQTRYISPFSLTRFIIGSVDIIFHVIFFVIFFYYFVPKKVCKSFSRSLPHLEYANSFSSSVEIKK